MKKKLQLLLIAMLVLVLAVGCSSPSEEIAEDSVALEPEELVTEESTPEVEEEEVANKFPKFDLKTLKEEDISQEIFTEHELTLVNIWGTTCAPCIREMPELQKLQTDYEAKGLKVIGIVTDANHLAAKEITDALLLTYDQIIPDEDFITGYLREFQFIPTTLFVDKEGVIIGDPMIGAYDYETFEEKVKEYLEIE